MPADNVKITSAVYANAAGTLVSVLLSTGETWTVPPNNGSGQANVLAQWVKEGGNIGPFVPPVPGGVTPVGSLIWYAAGRVPPGWLPCDGSEIKRAQYARLFSTIGTTFGSGNGTTTFNLPDLSAKFVRGWGPVNPVDLGRTFGSTQNFSLGPHSHPITDPGHTHSIFDPGHLHGVVDPGHNHGIVDPGHTHSVPDPGHGHVIWLYEIGYLFLISVDKPYNVCAPPNYTPFGSTVPFSLSTVDANLTVNAKDANIGTELTSTGVTVDPALTGVSVDPHVTNITNTNLEGGVETRPFNLSLLPYIKY